MKEYGIKIDDGKIRIKVENMDGEYLGDIKINPDDTNLIVRANSAQIEITKLIDEAFNRVNEADAALSDEEAIEMLTDIDEKIKAQINHVFDYDVSEVVFKNQHCLNQVGGKPFVERLLDAIFPVIEEVSKQEQERSRERVEKYTNQVK